MSGIFVRRRVRTKNLKENDCNQVTVLSSMLFGPLVVGKHWVAYRPQGHQGSNGGTLTVTAL
jgi:hypothetical protein